MDRRVAAALERGHLIDITTTGRRTGQPRRIEVTFFNFDGRIFISGMPGRRSWYANLTAEPRFTFHLKGPVKADLPATARPVTDPAERTALFEKIARMWRRTDLDRMIARSPLVEVKIDEGEHQEPGGLAP
jgi:deazaflavin-dependent oxidoreductase (nitroreductase family)